MPADSNLTPTPAMPDIERMPGHALLTQRQLSAISSFAVVTLRAWATKGRGPRITRIENSPRYMVRDVRAWLEASRERA